MSYSNYQNAADSVKNAVIAALNNDEETNTLCELWRHYLGLRRIADNASKELVEDTLSFKESQDFWKGDGISLTGNPGTASSDTITFTFSEGDSGIDITKTYGAAESVPLGGMGTDIITFN